MPRTVNLTKNCQELLLLSHQEDKNGCECKESFEIQSNSQYAYSARHPVYKLIDELGWDTFYKNLCEEVNQTTENI